MKTLGSIKLSVVLLLIYACGAGVATFIEAKYDTSTAWAMVYGAWWFAIVQFALGINLFAALLRYAMHKRPALFIFHLSFLFMLIGAIMTRFLGFEGMLHLRLNEPNSTVSTFEKFLSLETDNKSASKSIYLSLLGSNHHKVSIDGATLSMDELLLHAKPKYINDASGQAAILMQASSTNGSAQLALNEGKFIVLGNTVVAFNKPISPSMRTLQLELNSAVANFDFELINTKTLVRKTIKAGEKIEYQNGDMIAFNDYKLTKSNSFKSAIKIYEASDDAEYANAIKATLSNDAESKVLYLFEDEPKVVSLGSKEYRVLVGSKLLDLGFKVNLDEFKLERYAGSNSPKSYESFITINDSGSEQKEHIFMNNVLDYKGKRFFQSQYDQDLEGSYLSINQDPGKLPTYVGYFLLGLGLLLNILSPKSRFRQLAKQVAKLSLGLFVLANLNQFAKADMLEDALKSANAKLERVSKEEHLKELRLLGVKKANSRIAPFGVEAADVLSKISHKRSFLNKDATEVLLDIMSDFNDFKDKKIILIGDKRINEIIHESGKYASFADFFKDGSYALKEQVNEASRTPYKDRTTLQKELLKVDERLNVLYFASLGGYLTAINENSMFVNPLDATSPSGKAYLLAINEAAHTGNYALASSILKRIKIEQGTEFNENKFALEIKFYEFKLFSKLIGAFLIVGLVLLGVMFAQILRAKAMPKLRKFLVAISVILFIALSIGLGIRGYLAGHAPWSNSYESLLYIAWALSLSGVMFARASAISLALANILAGITLFVAHLSNIDPQIGNLAPVLSSIYLSIHVSVITASYGFLGLCALLGLFTLVLFILIKPENATRLKPRIKEASMINEMAMILGLSLLTMGNFLGGVWANESWGRYWGWDSKETWALVSILIYAIVLHIRLIKRFNNQFIFALFSLFAYYVILMTYFGVNYFLAGMHSYAAGNAASVPIYAYIITLVLIIIAILAARNYKHAEHL